MMLPSQEFDSGNAFLGRLGEPVGEVVPDGRICIQIAFFDELLNHCSIFRIGLYAISDFMSMIPCCCLRSQLSREPAHRFPSTLRVVYHGIFT